MTKPSSAALRSVLSLGLCLPISAVAADLWFQANIREIVVDTLQTCSTT